MRHVAELDAVVGEHDSNLVGNGVDKSLEEIRGCSAIGALMQLGKSELRGTIDRDEEIELACFGADLGNVDVKEADRISLEAAARSPS